MYSNNILNKIKKTAILFSLIFGFMVISNTATQAQSNRESRKNRYSRSNSGRNNSIRIAQQYGYRDGMKDGADAAREGDRYHPKNSGDWQKGTNGYESRYGSKSAYKQAYRQAYLQGYRAGFDRLNNRNNRRRNN